MPELGDLLEGKYRLLRLLGEGGMGSVYEAEHEGIGRRMAVKFLRAEVADDVDTVERFKREARAATRIGHPTIIGVTDFGQTEADEHFMVMEFLAGQSLRQIIDQRGPLEPSLAAYIVCHLLSALDAAHGAGIVHRDLKPDNIFLVEQGRDFPEVRLLDFGISKIADPKDTVQTLTKTGTALGTPSYMSPEQAWGDRAVDHRSDLWSLGVVLYECVTRKIPFVASHIFSLVRKITDEPYLPARQHVPELPEELEAVITRALEKQPDDRFQTSREMFDALIGLVDPAAKALIPKPTGAAPVATSSGTPAVMSAESTAATTADTMADVEVGGQELGVAPTMVVSDSSQQTPPPTSSTIAEPRRAPTMVLALVGLLLLAGVGVGVWLGLAPEPDDDGAVVSPAALPERPADTLGPDAAAGVAASLEPVAPAAEVERPRSLVELTKRALAGVTASSILGEDEGGRLYGPEKVVDGRSNTAWGAARKQYRGEWLELRFDREVSIISIDVQPGYNKVFRGNDLFQRNRRVKRARLQIGQWSAEQEFRDALGWQTVRLSAPVRGSALRFTILDIYEGSHWPDLHISEIRVWGTVD